MPFLDKYIFRIIPILLLSGLLAGCKLMTPLPKKVALSAPRTFMERMDSASLGNRPVREFFADPKLAALIDTAFRLNPDVSIALQRIEIARATVLEREGDLLPTVNAEVSGGVRRFGEYSSEGVGNYDTNFSDNINPDQKMSNPLPDYFVGARSSWEIDIWRKLRTRRRGAYLRFLATEKAQQMVVTNLVAEISRLYYELLTLDSKFIILKRNEALQQQAVESIIIQKQAGRANELAVKQFTAQLLNTQAQEIRINQDILVAENQVNRLLGRFSQPIARGDAILDQEFPTDIGVGVPAEMVRRRPDVQQAELELRAFEADLQAARLAFLPSLTISPYIGFHAFRSALLFNPASLAFGLLGGVTAPLINRKALKAGQRRSQAEAIEALYTYNKAVINAYQEATLNMRTMDNLALMLDLKEQETTMLQEGVSISNDLFVAGYANYLEIITAQRSVLAAELEQTDIQQQRFTALVNLYRALGGGWE